MNKNQLLEELSDSFLQLQISRADQVYITGNVSKLARTRLHRDEILASLYESLIRVLSDEGTIFSPAASMNLCNTDIAFDVNKTPSYEMGPLAEFLRLKTDSNRSLHPFWSICGNGKNSSILNHVSRHSYGIMSPWSHFLDMDVKQINIGLHPSKAVTLIHHIETTFGVPYRYTKEFIHPVIRGNRVVKEPFYMSVMYKEANIQKKEKLNEHYFHKLSNEGKLFHAKHQSGIDLWSFSMRDFYETASSFFIEDIYNYLETEPTIKPYQS
tara:strand:- start:15742 stop:16548 length:807 start_codon:yes stop_codon:yes gene_type:complete